MISILCVDNEPLNLSLLEAMLTPRGYDVVTADNGLSALQKLGAGNIDICLLDVMMPGMDGFEVCRRIKGDEAHRDIPVVMITSLDDTENRIQGIEAGAEDFISKPFDTAEVLARIKMLLRVRELNNRLNSAYHNLAKLSAFGERSINTFNPLSFDFLEKIESIVQQIIRTGNDVSHSPEIVVIGMLQPLGACQWLCFDSRGRDVERKSIPMNPDHAYVFSGSGIPLIGFYNQGDPELVSSPLVRELEKHSIRISNIGQICQRQLLSDCPQLRMGCYHPRCRGTA